MIPYAKALRILESEAETRGELPSEKIPIGQALGRVSAEGVLSPEDLPAFANSAMDGYAVLASKTAGASPASPARLKVLGAVPAGDRPSKGKPDSAYEIHTGAPLPLGLDAVVRLEEATVLDGDGEIELSSPASRWDFVRQTGEDLKAGTQVLKTGTRIEGRHLLVLAALGLRRVSARRSPRVALISTGRELVEPGQRPGPGRIRNATASYLLASLPLAGAQASYLGNVPDEPRDFERRLGKALALRPDLILTTGAVSAGRRDFIEDSLKRCGGRILFHGAAVKPGKPVLAAGFSKGPLLIGMPGNPVSTVVALRFFALPFLRRLLGQPRERPLRARLVGETHKPLGLRCFLKARVSLGPQGLLAQALPGQASFQIKPLLDANAWLVLPEEGSPARAARGPQRNSSCGPVRSLPLAGKSVEVFPLWPGGWDLP